ncbi:Serine/threonine protein kinase [Nakamurella panacisegetis]|uniref:non-specific serine/threonine protein kinase n=1 Tax=Nakamurella panacisegetis TaxID=1090615 RepID=A0A1H0PB61_9ACTN|nr:serine/threonine-protein kinase [Nakamurella panacisegetis]SDP01898.1 Serine/threonine protein kinase [Nakamurella panacisegetis]
MMRPPVAPPDIPGLRVGRHLGGGGFADVYLYEQSALGRKVAVKVLRANASTEEVRRQFTAESRLMAALSDHINIVTIHDAAIAADGRPYLVMAYCPGLNLADRYKTQQIPVAEVLSIGVQLAGAVETAHRQGILHRDIKPANVLTAPGGRPALTDFGISVAMGAMHEEESVGLSIPWSPPEMLSGAPAGDHRADVYSLAATIFTLLARRSPFELIGRSNEQIDLITRIQRMPLTPTGRADVPQTVEAVLAIGLNKDPGRRYQSALELARALQQLEAEMGGSVTPVDISAEDPVAAVAELAPKDDGRTRIRPLVIQAQHPATDPAAPPVDRTRMRGLTGPTAADRPHLRPADLAPPPPPVDTEVRPPVGPIPVAVPVVRRSRIPVLVGVAVLLVVLGVVGFVLAQRGTSPVAAPESTAPATRPSLVQVSLPSAPTNLTGKPVGPNVQFTWVNPDPVTGDTFQWRRTDQDSASASSWTDTTKPTAVVVGAGRACIEVVVVRANSSLSNAATACAPRN